MTVEVALVVSIVSVSFSIFFGLRNNKRSDVKEIEQRVRERTETNMKLDNIGKCVAEIKDNISDTKRDLQEVKEKLFLVEQKINKAHYRIDALEKYDKKEVYDANTQTE